MGRNGTPARPASTIIDSGRIASPSPARTSTAPSGSRAEVLAGFFLGAYIGLSAPVIALGVATEYAAPRDVMLVFVVLAAVAIAVGSRAVLHHSNLKRIPNGLGCSPPRAASFRPQDR